MIVSFTDPNIKQLINEGMPLRSVFGDIYIDSLITGAHENDITGAWAYHDSIHELFLCSSEDLLSQ